MVKSSQEKPAADRTDSLFRGVRKRKWGKWVSEIRLPNSRQRIWLGSYATAEKAARALEAAMSCLRGTNGRFNFPGNPPNISGGRSMTPAQIQIAAARFANSEPQMENSVQHVNTPADSSFSSSSEGTTLLPMESPSPVSDITVQTETDGTLRGPFPDLFSAIGTGNYEPDYSVFPGFNDFSSDFYLPELPNFDYGEENLDGLIFEDPYLWNF